MEEIHMDIDRTAQEPLTRGAPDAGAGDTAQQPLARVESLLEQLEALPDPAARDTAMEVVQALLDLYGEGLERIVDVLAARDDGTLAQTLADDELVAHLLLLHGLHPVPVQERVRGALESVLPYLESHGGSVELLEVDEGIARLRLEGSCSGCPSSAMTLKLAIEEAIFKAAPDVEEVRAEGAVDPLAPPAGLLQLEVLGGSSPAPALDVLGVPPAPSLEVLGSPSTPSPEVLGSPSTPSPEVLGSPPAPSLEVLGSPSAPSPEVLGSPPAPSAVPGA
jgi:Fe-S cluster biogenesis protein NfuA